MIGEKNTPQDFDGWGGGNHKLEVWDSRKHERNRLQIECVGDRWLSQPSVLYPDVPGSILKILIILVSAFCLKSSHSYPNFFF